MVTPVAFVSPWLDGSWAHCQARRMSPGGTSSRSYITNASSIFDFICYADDTTLFSTLNNLVNAQNINPDIIINKELAKINCHSM